MPSMFGVAAGSVARAGWRGLVLALLGASLGLAGLPSPLDVLLFPVLALATTVIVVALIRVFAAHRPEPLPPLPIVDAEGRRVGRPQRVPLVDATDRSPGVALRRAAAVARPLLTYVALELLLLVVAVMLIVPFATESLGSDTIEDREAFGIVVPVQLVAALLTAFVSLVPQRIGLEGDPRVLVAAAHSVRVARTTFGPMFLVSVGRTLPGLGAAALVAYDRPVAARVAVALIAVPVEMLAVAVLNEVYFRGPRLDVPAEFGSRQGVDQTRL